MGIEKATKTEHRTPPDAEGWRKAAERKDLDKYFIQDVVRAARECNETGDRKTLVVLMGHISDQILNVLRGFVGTNHHNDGKDIIHDVHSHLIHAVLIPESKDGQALCKAFVPRIRFRALDAIKKDKKKRTRYPSYDDVPEDRSTKKSHTPFDDVDESMQVEQILSTIPDARKRLAFRLFIDGCPIEGEDSISKAVNKSPRTVGTWIKEIKALLGAKIGENHD